MRMAARPPRFLQQYRCTLQRMGLQLLISIVTYAISTYGDSPDLNRAANKPECWEIELSPIERGPRHRDCDCPRRRRGPSGWSLARWTGVRNVGTVATREIYFG